jgi:hypothetical protein
MRICKECGTVIDEPAFKLTVIVEHETAGASQQVAGFNSLLDVTQEAALKLLECAKEQVAKFL